MFCDGRRSARYKLVLSGGLYVLSLAFEAVKEYSESKVGIELSMMNERLVEDTCLSHLDRLERRA